MGGSQSRLPYTLGQEHTAASGLWKLFDAEDKRTSDPVSVFVFNKKEAPGASLAVARNGVYRHRTLHFPSIIKFVDAVELEEEIYLVTERVTVLASAAETKDMVQSPDLMAWGLADILKGLQFLHERGFSHNGLRAQSIFVAASGAWKLGHLHLLTQRVDPSAEGAPVASASGAVGPDGNPVERPVPLTIPDVMKSAEACPLLRAANVKATDILRLPVHALDTWSVGFLLVQLFSGTNKSSPEEIQSLQELIPRDLKHLVAQCLSPQGDRRPPCGDLLQDPYFNKYLVQVVEFLESLQLRSPEERDEFFLELDSRFDSLPARALHQYILPSILSALQFGCGGRHTLKTALRIVSRLEESSTTFQKVLLPALQQLFDSQDRQIRVQLLSNAAEYIPRLQTAQIESLVYPKVENGFRDTVPLIRELTVKFMAHIASKLKPSTLANSVVKNLWQLQLDPEPAIRTNSTICIGKLAPHLQPKDQKKVLVPAFSRCFKDPFWKSRHAAVMAMAATLKFVDAEDVVHKVIPSLAPLCVDPFLKIRESALSTLRDALNIVEEASRKMPDEERELLEKESRECLHRPTAAVPPSSSRGVRGSAEDKRVSSGAPSSRTAGSASKPAPGPQSHPSAYSDAAISQYVSLGYSKEHVIRTFNVMRERGVPLNKTEEALDLLDELQRTGTIQPKASMKLDDPFFFGGTETSGASQAETSVGGGWDFDLDTPSLTTTKKTTTTSPSWDLDLPSASASSTKNAAGVGESGGWDLDFSVPPSSKPSSVAGASSGWDQFPDSSSPASRRSSTSTSSSSLGSATTTTYQPMNAMPTTGAPIVKRGLSLGKKPALGASPVSSSGSSRPGKLSLGAERKH